MIPGHRYDRVNVIGTLCDGVYYGIECYRHSTDAEFFEAWFNKMVDELPSGCTVIMDNASFHRKKHLRRLARGRVRLLFLPPYSPEFNKIEHSWANMKRHLRDSLPDFQHLENAVYDYFKTTSKQSKS